ncbi:uncharacterized protein PGTG_09521 [Puccinia graminis f. sp. tritici CRL 75-36-700-3]|uniref:Uncharacterized protein n=1 Tax=Puccinia graminis f. sp. tritici (strain CRL 75-36-700-3 / race SCCL) TaxID=418459 RepID=E3KHN3_PUCGT|nr:uncharacterized protein PGTG_09521 [Puccinia graminis f. sp. tritici CRL 75-36-700-3]EFP83808.2 hypothetical protein PGTG_09521 [Puccinia graminis f. sp. tritici CRL 75-36-700-3]
MDAAVVRHISTAHSQDGRLALCRQPCQLSSGQEIKIARGLPERPTFDSPRPKPPAFL